MKNPVRLFILMALPLIGVTTIKAEGEEKTEEEEKFSATIGTDFVSQYIWRGQDLGSFSVQPTMGIEYKGLSLSAWGNIGISNHDDTKELDLTLSYTRGGFNVGITDYWFSEGLNPYGKYFKYKAHETNHLFEANIGYDFKVLALQFYTNFAGNDGLNKDGKRAYSSYFELSAPFKLAKCDWEGAIGMVPYATDFYDVNGFAVINISLKVTKDIRVTDSFSIPIFGQLVANPRSEKAYFVIGFTLQP
ncbi:MAG: hypothetical protein IJ916_05580 [Paludibacteraceae bacterium]|nr:hypothetical protein [Paludibacteraceae bacterium]MBR2261155.1 hypothetical protein [Paludibacteraceae bacterium]MEE3483739.1 hypothetical protein [Bacteroidales bacterium]